MTLIIYYYSQIVSFVVNHEKALRKQAKKMNVESLRSNVNANAQSAEVRIAKVYLKHSLNLQYENLIINHLKCFTLSNYKAWLVELFNTETVLKIHILDFH